MLENSQLYTLENEKLRNCSEVTKRLLETEKLLLWFCKIPVSMIKVLGKTLLQAPTTLVLVFDENRYAMTWDIELSRRISNVCDSCIQRAERIFWKGWVGEQDVHEERVVTICWGNWTGDKRDSRHFTSSNCPVTAGWCEGGIFCGWEMRWSRIELDTTASTSYKQLCTAMGSEGVIYSILFQRLLKPVDQSGEYISDVVYAIICKQLYYIWQIE